MLACLSMPGDARATAALQERGAPTLGRRDAAVLALVPCAFLVAVLVYPSHQFHWDTLERAYLLEHAGRYLQSWDGSPRSQFFAFAHVLELPLAWIVGLALPGNDGMRTLVVFEALMGAVTLWLVGALVGFWRGRDGQGPCRVPAWLAQLTVALALAFFRMGSSGEEKILALATQLGFLLCFWTTLAAGGDRFRAGTGARAWPVGVTLAFAILAHLTGAVLVPFALLALCWLPMGWRPARGAVARAVILGAAAAGVLYYIVAASTTHVRGPLAFYEYLTFFHRGAASFWEPTGAPAAAGSRLARMALGLGSFFAGDAAARSVTLALLALGIGLPVLAARRRAGRGSEPGSLPAEFLRRHALLLAALWTAHFAFFEPQKHESWTLVAVLMVLAAAVSLPARALVAAAVLPGLLLVTNLRHYAATHAAMDFEPFRRLIDRMSRPGDLVVLTGGIQRGMALRGGLAMRYFLAHQRDRQVVNLYDVLDVTDLEFWERPYTSPAALQAALDSGRRAWVPRFLQEEINKANESGIVRITTVARGDSILEITRIESGP
jgi:hypothetical protein